MAAGNLTDVTQAAQDKIQVLSHTKNPPNKRVRHPPTLATALFDVKEAKGAGYGVFATQDIPSQTELLVSSSPSAYAIYRTFRKEVCAWCFKYERGRNWKVKLTTPARDDGDRPAVALNGGGMVFCSDDCRDAWYNEYGDVALEAYNALESYIQRQGRKESWNSGSQDQGIDQFSVLPSEEEVDKVWTIIERQAATIRRHRLRDRCQPETKANLKGEKKSVQEALTLPVVDTDILFFILSGVLCQFLSASSLTPSAWDNLLMLNPSNPYPSLNTLYLVVNAYLQLLAILPLPLIHDTVLNRQSIESVLSRDVGNSFGIWSTSDSEEDPEMLGYGIWTLASFFNHSCAPNISKERQGRKWVFTAAPLGGDLAITSGTELSITYIRGEEDILRVEDRRRKLQDGWGFVCQCSKCSTESNR